MKKKDEEMDDYISRQAAIEALAGWKISPIVLDPVPTADVVEVVRCKDCIWRDTIPRFNVFLSNGCRWHESESPDDDDFCSYGERADK